MEVALLHVWNSGHSVSDEVFRVWSQAWPDAEQYTATQIDAASTSGGSFQEFPRISGEGAELLPMIRNYDLILSTSPEASRRFQNAQSHYHMCYLSHVISSETRQPKRFTPRMSSRQTNRLPVARHAYLSPWNDDDCALPERVTHWISASRSVRELNGFPRSLHSLVLYPPINTSHFHPVARQREEFYLVVCRDGIPEGLEMAATACSYLGRTLVIAATPELAERIPEDLQSRVQVFSKDSALAAWYGRCAGVIFPGIVDYDSALVEAQACGAPVIAYREGSAVELLIDGEECPQGTGLFFDSPSVNSLVSALEELERRPQHCSPALAWSCALAYSERQFEARTFRLIREILHAEGQRTLERDLRLREREAA